MERRVEQVRPAFGELTLQTVAWPRGVSVAAAITFGSSK
jgi:hypothetical protein